MDLYKTEDMLESLEYVHVAGDFLLNLLVTGVETHATDTINIDIERNGKKMAPFTSPLREGVVITKEGFSSVKHTIPYIKMKVANKAQEAMRRMAGKTIWQGQTPKSFIAKEMTKQLKEMDTMIFRREEWMLAQGIQSGIIPVVGEGVSYAIDMQMKGTHKPVLLTVDRWSEDTADIIGDLDAWAELIYDDCGRTATHAILGRNASKALMSNEAYKGSLDRRRIIRGEIDVKRLPKGVKYFGFDNESALDLYGYTEKFYNTTTEQQEDLIDADSVIVLATGARVERHYGMIQRADTDYIGPRYPHNWLTEDPSVHWVSLESAPLVAPHEIDAFVCAKVL